MATERPLGGRDPRWPFPARQLLGAMKRIVEELAEIEDWPAVRVDATLLLGDVLQGSNAPQDVVMSVLGPRAVAYCRAVEVARVGKPLGAHRESIERYRDGRHRKR